VANTDLPIPQQFIAPPPAERILAAQRQEAQRARERNQQEQSALESRNSVIEAFDRVRHCSLPALQTELGRGVDLSVLRQRMAGHLVPLAQLLCAKGLLSYYDSPVNVPKNREEARLFALQIVRLAASGEPEPVVRLLEEAEKVPFGDDVYEWLRRDLAFEIYPRLLISPRGRAGRAGQGGLIRGVRGNSVDQAALPVARLPQVSGPRLDPSRCPGCQAPVPEEYSTLPEVPCLNCGRWELYTGVGVVPTAGPPGTPPGIFRSCAPFWQPLLPGQLKPPPRGGKGTRSSAGNGIRTKRRLEESNPQLFQVYTRIKQESQAGERHKDIVARLKTDKQFSEQVKEAGRTLDVQLVKNALALFDQRDRAQARKNQDPPGT
jgi:hypothetical protein